MGEHDTHWFQTVELVGTKLPLHSVHSGPVRQLRQFGIDEQATQVGTVRVTSSPNPVVQSVHMGPSIHETQLVKVHATHDRLELAKSK